MIVTHELDIASYARRVIVMRDGVMVSDTVNERRRRAVDERAELDRAELAAQLLTE